jgi:hypothetical protein
MDPEVLERWAFAEILRIKGWILQCKGDTAGAQHEFQASLDWARQQQAKSWELRTSTSLAQLWQSQGKRKEALDLLAPVYDWFTEGFDTKDMKESCGDETCAARRRPVFGLSTAGQLPGCSFVCAVAPSRRIRSHTGTIDPCDSRASR